MQSAGLQSPATSTAKRKKKRKSGADASAQSNGPATGNGGTAAGSGAVDAPSLVSLGAELVAVVGWEAAARGAGGGHAALTTGRLRAVVIDTLYGTVQAVHRRAFKRFVCGRHLLYALTRMQSNNDDLRHAGTAVLAM